MTATSEPRWHRREDVVVRRAPSGLLLAPVRPDVISRPTEVLSLGGSGAVVWELLADAPTLDELLAAITARLGADRPVADGHESHPADTDTPPADTIARDVRTLLDDLERAGVVTVG